MSVTIERQGPLWVLWEFREWCEHVRELWRYRREGESFAWGAMRGWALWRFAWVDGQWAFAVGPVTVYWLPEDRGGE
ncbi:MAG: hypothetical protein U0990_09580 [Candidatus Nanopelagicales bacterium]|nr:hypothetical protein [Candidatus Nanopelagicales bacterium]